ncbi:hypothetical protein [Halorussus aquaticus]|uniref:Uncharacterized protein n=1 Tax=Halorussus aquaticus TaxID=2953748 RepID=A0ABD5Q2C9_9EURY|nr:hypothetical protein [Halorussus aquaticus]
MVNIIQNVLDLIGYIGEAAFSFPTSILLVAVGSLLILFSVAVFGYLTAGAVVDLLIPESLGRPPQQRG